MKLPILSLLDAVLVLIVMTVGLNQDHGIFRSRNYKL